MFKVGKFAEGLVALVFAVMLTATAIAAAAGPAQAAAMAPTGLA